MTLWDSLRKRGVTVQPLVVLWDGGVRNWEEPKRTRMLDGVPVITGPAIGAWTQSLPADVLEPAQVEAAWAAIEMHTSKRDAYDVAAHPLPPGIGDYVTRAAVTLACAFLGFLALGQLLHLLDSVWWTVGCGAATLGLAVVIVRVPRLRWLAWGWIVGVGIPTVALTVAEALSALT
jgi:hypothetical protein